MLTAGFLTIGYKEIITPYGAETMELAKNAITLRMAELLDSEGKCAECGECYGPYKHTNNGYRCLVEYKPHTAGRDITEPFNLCAVCRGELCSEVDVALA